MQTITTREIDFENMKTSVEFMIFYECRKVPEYLSYSLFLGVFNL